MSMRNLTSESMKLEMHGMGAEIKELRAKPALAEKKLAIAVEGIEELGKAANERTGFLADPFLQVAPKMLLRKIEATK